MVIVKVKIGFKTLKIKYSDIFLQKIVRRREYETILKFTEQPTQEKKSPVYHCDVGEDFPSSSKCK